MLGGYITKFEIDFTQFYIITERDFFKGPQNILEFIFYMDKDVVVRQECYENRI
jgi:hypothetical protein